MAYSKETTLKGDTVTYTLSPAAKKFALKDVGFNETKRGNFVLERGLDPDSPYNPKVTLKITVDADLTGFWMKALTSNGLHEVNIFELPESKGMVEQFRYNMNAMIERDILMPVAE
ncbi:DUF1831 domain-containing protein [uncultured Secundilactobacillus sp.]|uniref:DUF1831 domain-containing protein n=1 Tax=uncultured Secundilactobacillus sp. TaxID=2813935 RepID=UPI00258A45E0|nr:DUF1831 domain-containing protein [uncultured Secundilactobacillus sp.]